eukprot:GHVN01096545.1.p1 GENE.GHVN01096545.1~~GHVN01096545.1.p1  ORF type:complete len:111 (-),score=79.48 GHVN01096545.1:102-434(-)
MQTNVSEEWASTNSLNQPPDQPPHSINQLTQSTTTTSLNKPPRSINHLTQSTTSLNQPPHSVNHLTQSTTSLNQPPRSLSKHTSNRPAHTHFPHERRSEFHLGERVRSLR